MEILNNIFCLGDVHFYGYEDDSWNSTTYPITRFLSETGIQSLPSLDTWYETTTNLSDLTFNSSHVLHREHSENQTNAMMFVQFLSINEKNLCFDFIS
jgi:hypothetical protein